MLNKKPNNFTKVLATLCAASLFSACVEEVEPPANGTSNVDARYDHAQYTAATNSTGSLEGQWLQINTQSIDIDGEQSHALSRGITNLILNDEPDTLDVVEYTTPTSELDPNNPVSNPDSPLLYDLNSSTIQIPAPNRAPTPEGESPELTSLNLSDMNRASFSETISYEAYLSIYGEITRADDSSFDGMTQEEVLSTPYIEKLATVTETTMTSLIYIGTLGTNRGSLSYHIESFSSQTYTSSQFASAVASSENTSLITPMPAAPNNLSVISIGDSSQGIPFSFSNGSLYTCIDLNFDTNEVSGSNFAQESTLEINSQEIKVLNYLGTSGDVSEPNTCNPLNNFTQAQLDNILEIEVISDTVEGYEATITGVNPDDGKAINISFTLDFTPSP